MSVLQKIACVMLAAIILTPGAAMAERPLLPSDLYSRTSYYYGQPPEFPPQRQKNVWYKWGYFGAYPAPRTPVGGHYSHRNHYTELRFSAPR